jgi:predicted secreted Zn-dependent protease
MERIIMRSLALCLFLVALPGAAEVIETLTFHTYNVPDNPRKSLAKSINEVSPIRENGRTFHGYTKWFVNWRYKWHEDSNGRCTITNNKVTVRGEITLPDAKPSDPEQSQQFSKYIANLRTHELGHFQIAQTVAKKIDEQILSLPGMESCKLMGKRANDIGNELLEQTKQIELDYDRTTEHGRTQGAWLEK